MFGIDIYNMIVSKMLKLTLTRILHREIIGTILWDIFRVLHDFVTKTIKINNFVTFVGIFSAVILRKKTFMLLVSILISNSFVDMFDGF